MLFTIIQILNLSKNLLSSSFSNYGTDKKGNDIATEITKENTNVGKYIKENSEEIKNFVNSLDKNSGAHDNVLVISELTYGNNLSALEKILMELGLGTEKLKGRTGQQKEEIIRKIDEYIGKKKEIGNNTREKTSITSNEIIQNNTLDYKIIKGDTIQSIANKYGLTVSELLALQNNRVKSILRSKSELSPGIIIKIPNLNVSTQANKTLYNKDNSSEGYFNIGNNEKDLNNANKNAELIISQFENTKKTKEDIINLQKALVALGYKLAGRNQGIDGSLGKSTLNAYNEAKNKINIASTETKESINNNFGKAKELIKKVLESNGSKNINPIDVTRREASLAEIVSAVEIALTELKYYEKPLKNPKLALKMAIKKFQDANGVRGNHDGKINYDTLFKIGELLGVVIEKPERIRKKGNNKTAKKSNLNNGVETSWDGIRTVEKTDGKINITFGSGREDFVGLRKNINNASFERLINGMSFEQLKAFRNEIVQVSNANYSKGDLWVYNWGSLGKIISVFEKKGYKADGFWGGIEVGSLVALTQGIYLTQGKILNDPDAIKEWSNIGGKNNNEINKPVSWKEKLALVLDYDKNGFIDTDIHFYTEEKELFDKIETEQQFDNFLRNLGYGVDKNFNSKNGDGIKALYDSLDRNYSYARAELKARIGTVLSIEDPLNPMDMINKPNAMKDYVKFREKSSKGVLEAINTHNKTKFLPEETKKIIENNMLTLLGGARFGAAVGFNIKDATNQILDTAMIGVIDGIPGIGITKHFDFKNGRVQVDLGAINFVPFAGVNGQLNQAQAESIYREKLFPLEFKNNAQVTLSVNVSPVSVITAASIDAVNEHTKKGIEASVRNMSQVLDKVFKDISNGKSFEKSSFNIKGNDTDKLSYERLVGLYNSYGGGDEAIRLIKEGALKNHENELYSNAGEGYHFSGITVGVLFYVAGFIPFAGVRFETNWTEWNEVETYTTIGSNEMIKSGVDNPQIATLLDKFASFEKNFDFKTRTKKGAGDILDPRASLDKKWKGLLELSKSIPGLTDFLSTINTDNERKAILSAAIQEMKKSKNFDNGNIDSWNRNVESYINIDNTRRKGFNTILGFNADAEAEKYYSQLRASKGKIGSTRKTALGFDAAASLNVHGTKGAQKGVEVLYTRLSMLTANGKEIMIPITDKNKINGFINKIESLNLVPELRQGLIEGLKNGNYVLQYYKDPEGFDDRVLITNKNGFIIDPKDIIRVYQPTHKQKEVGLFGVGKTNKWGEKDKPNDNGGKKEQETKPGNDERSPEGGSGGGNFPSPDGPSTGDRGT